MDDAAKIKNDAEKVIAKDVKNNLPWMQVVKHGCRVDLIALIFLTWVKEEVQAYGWGGYVIEVDGIAGSVN